MSLPNFLIIGAAKAGTTSLYHYLRQHPDVFMSGVKEPQYYWDEGPKNMHPCAYDRSAYERLFEGSASSRAAGEASPQYLHSPTAPARIAADIPESRLIVSLRNPADRAYSSYLGRRRGARERRGVEQAMTRDGYYFQTSLYAPALSRYFALFPRGQVKVVLFDELTSDTCAVMRDICAFLDIDIDAAREVDVTTKHNPASVPRWILPNTLLLHVVKSAQAVLPPAVRNTGLAARVQRHLLRAPDPLPEPIRRRMLDQFRDDIDATGNLIGRDLSRWLD